MAAYTEVFEITYHTETDTIVVHTICPWCTYTHDVSMPSEDWRKIQNGDVFLATALPHMDENDRELLISGICSGCWDKYLGD